MIVRAWIGLLLWLAAAAAFAHASLIATSPVDGARLDRAPAALQLHFNEPVSPLVLKLIGPDGGAVAIEAVEAMANGLQARLPAGEARGTYLLSWRVVSADGHPVGGSLTWSVGAPSASVSPAGATSAAPGLRAAIWSTRLALSVLLFFGIGAVLFRAFVATDPAPPRWAARGLLVSVPLLALSVGLLGLDALSAGWAALLTPPPWQAGLSTSYAFTAGLMLLAVLFGLMGSSARRGLARTASMIALLLLASALAASGHASSAPPRWLARPAVFLHAVAITAWVGSLIPLLLALRSLQGAAALQRFSRVIPWFIALLIASGTSLALLQLDRLDALWTTDYGRILGAKLIVVVLLLGVAAVNRHVLSERIRRGQWDARAAMRRLIRIEVALVLVVLALAATWRFTPPPRALAAVLPPKVVYAHLHGEKAMADLVLTPQTDGALTAHLDILLPGDSPGPEEVTLELSRPGIEPLQRPAQRQPDGSWQVAPFALPSSGRWQVQVDVLISDFERARLEADVDVP